MIELGMDALSTSICDSWEVLGKHGVRKGLGGLPDASCIFESEIVYLKYRSGCGYIDWFLGIKVIVRCYRSLVGGIKRSQGGRRRDGHIPFGEHLTGDPTPALSARTGKLRRRASTGPDRRTPRTEKSGRQSCPGSLGRGVRGQGVEHGADWNGRWWL